MAVEVIYVYDLEKSTWLREHRGIGFEEIVQYIEDGWLLDVVADPNPRKYPNRLAYEVEVDGYVIVVPFIRRGQVDELKTLFPSRKATRKYKGESHEK